MQIVAQILSCFKISSISSIRLLAFQYYKKLTNSIALTAY